MTPLDYCNFNLQNLLCVPGMTIDRLEEIQIELQREAEDAIRRMIDA